MVNHLDFTSVTEAKEGSQFLSSKILEVLGNVKLLWNKTSAIFEERFIGLIESSQDNMLPLLQVRLTQDQAHHLKIESQNLDYEGLSFWKVAFLLKSFQWMLHFVSESSDLTRTCTLLLESMFVKIFQNSLNFWRWLVLAYLWPGHVSGRQAKP